MAGCSQLAASLIVWCLLVFLTESFGPPSLCPRFELGSSRRQQSLCSPLSSKLSEGIWSQEEDDDLATSRTDRRRRYTARWDNNRSGINGAGGGAKETPVGVFQPYLFQVFDPKQKDTKKRAQALALIENDRVLTSTLSSWAKSRASDAPERCYEVLDHLRKHHNSSGRRGALSVNAFLYSVVINAYAKRGRAEEAESVLREVIERSVANATGSQGGGIIMKNNYMYNSVIGAWYKTKDGAEHCNRLLTEMERLSQSTGRKELGPDIGTYNTVLNALVVGGRLEEAECLLRDMLVDVNKLTPNNLSFNCILKAWSQSSSSDAPERCRRLLDAMKQLADERREVTPNVVSHGYVLGAYEQHARAQDAENLLREMISTGTVLPSAQCFSSVMKAWLASGVDEAPDRCLRLLGVMEHLSVRFRKRHNGDAPWTKHPPIPLYKIVLGALAKVGRGQEAETLILQMLRKSKIVPDVECFNLVAAAWSKSDADDAPERCRRLLDGMMRMTEKLQGGRGATFAPNTETYNAVIDAFASRGRAKEAECVLRDMQMAAAKADISNPLPDAVSFATVMTAWSKSDADDARERCLHLLDEMQELSMVSGNQRVEADVPSYKFVIGALADRWQPVEVQHPIQSMNTTAVP